MQLTAFIVDDEQHVRQTLYDLLLQFCPEVDVLGSAGTVEEAFGALQVHRPDVLFLDVNLGGNSSGFDLLDRMLRPALDVVFVTAYAEHAVKAFEYDAGKPQDAHRYNWAYKKAKRIGIHGGLAKVSQRTSK